MYFDDNSVKGSFEEITEEFDQWHSSEHWTMRVSTWLYAGAALVVLMVVLGCCCRRRRRGQVLAPPPPVPPTPAPAPYPRQQFTPPQAYPVVTAYPIAQSHNTSFPAPYPAGGAHYPTSGVPYPESMPSAPMQNALPPTYDQAVGLNPYEKHLPYNPSAPPH